jgi:hypothetical protein
VVKNNDRTSDRRIIAQAAGDAMKSVGETEVKPDRTRASESDIGTMRDSTFHRGLVSGQVRELGGASGSIESGEVKGHRLKASAKP